MDDDAPFRVSRAAGSPELATITTSLLGRLPAWFGIPQANAAYARAARELPGFLAHSMGGEPIGILLHKRHFAESAEIHLMAVQPDWHRRGVGAALVHAAASELRTDGCQVLQAKTLGPSDPDHGYERTRAFYRAVGFIPIEETHDLWPGNPCLLMIKILADSLR